MLLLLAERGAEVAWPLGGVTLRFSFSKKPKPLPPGPEMRPDGRPALQGAALGGISLQVQGAGGAHLASKMR